MKNIKTIYSLPMVATCAVVDTQPTLEPMVPEATHDA